MSFPFYVNPEQMTQDKAEFARKGIARGKSIVTLEFEGGVLMVAENPLKLQKVGEIYDWIAFAGVGKFSEFDRLRKMGIQWADVEGFRFSRDDVRGKALANVYSQILGEEFTRSIPHRSSMPPKRKRHTRIKRQARPSRPTAQELHDLKRSQSRAEDGVLIRRALRGDQKSFEKLRVKYHESIHNLIFRMIREKEEVEDLTQEAFIKAFTSLASFNEEYAFSTWPSSHP